jgi:hypothetical protein
MLRKRLGRDIVWEGRGLFTNAERGGVTEDVFRIEVIF